MPEIDPLDLTCRGVHHRYTPVRIAFPAGKRDVEFGTVIGNSKRVRLATERLRDIRPMLAACLHDRVVRINAVTSARRAVEVAGPEHDLGEPGHACALSRGFGSDDVFHRVSGSARNDLPL